MEGLIRPRKVYKRGLPRAPGAEDANNDTLSYIKRLQLLCERSSHPHAAQDIIFRFPNWIVGINLHNIFVAHRMNTVRFHGSADS